MQEEQWVPGLVLQIFDNFRFYAQLSRIRWCRDLRALSGKFLREKSCCPESFCFFWLCPSPPLLSRKFSVTRVLEHFLYSSYSNLESQNYAVEKLAGVQDFFSLFKQGVLKGFWRAVAHNTIGKIPNVPFFNWEHSTTCNPKSAPNIPWMTGWQDTHSLLYSLARRWTQQQCGSLTRYPHQKCKTKSRWCWQRIVMN